MDYRPSDEQVGGTHYKGLAIDAYQFCMHNDWDPAAFTILKRLVRYDKKDWITDLRKALHEVDIRNQLWNRNLRPQCDFHQRIRINDFIKANGLANERVCDALRYLDLWVWTYNQGGADNCIRHIKDNIELLIADLVSVPP